MPQDSTTGSSGHAWDSILASFLVPPLARTALESLWEPMGTRTRFSRNASSSHLRVAGRKDPVAPESRFGILGGGSLPPIGTFSEYVVVERDQVIPTPAHLDDVQAAAWPLGGLTAWRATMVNAHVERGHNVLITGVGGGVALLALQLCVAKGANVYVTSGTDEKIAKAVALGAKGGVKYKDEDWPQQLGKLLKRDGQESLDSVVDSAGGDIMRHTLKLLKQGGKVVCYGMTAAPAITFRMPDVMRNVQLLGSTMGSHQDLLDATAFMEKHRIVPVVSNVLEGIDAAEEGFEIMKKGSQFGKIIVKMEGLKQAKL